MQLLPPTESTPEHTPTTSATAATPDPTPPPFGPTWCTGLDLLGRGRDRRTRNADDEVWPHGGAALIDLIGASRWTEIAISESRDFAWLSRELHARILPPPDLLLCGYVAMEHISASFTSSALIPPARLSALPGRVHSSDDVDAWQSGVGYVRSTRQTNTGISNTI